MRNGMTLLLLVMCVSSAGCWAAYQDSRSAWFCLYGASGLLVYLVMAHTALLKGFKIERSISKARCWSGEPVGMKLRLRFARPCLPSSSLSVEQRWRHQATGEWIVLREIARPGLSRTVELDMMLPGLPRGLYRLDVLSVSMHDAFGLLRFSRRADAGQHELIVLPKPLPLPVPEDGAGGELPRAGRRQPLQRQSASPFVYGTRPYSPGDPFHRIHWRSTARAGALRAKETEQPGPDRLLVCLDAAGGRANAAAFESAVEAAAGLAKHALQLGLSVRLAAGDRQGHALEAHGRERLPALLRLLALLPCEGDRPLAAWVQREMLHLGPGARVAVVTARPPDEQLLHLLRRLRGRAVHLVYAHGGGLPPGAVEQWRRQAEAAGCRFTAVGGTAGGGEGDGAAADRDSAGA